VDVNREKDRIRRAKQAILVSGDSCSLKDIIDSDADAFSGIRMLYASNASGAELQLKEEHKHVFSGIFCKEKLLAYSDAIHEEMQKGTSVITYKRRALFDTNLLSVLPKFILGESFTTRERVEDILKIVSSNYSGGFDYSFAMLENLREFTKENNPHPVNKVAAAKYFDALVSGKESRGGRSRERLESYYQESERTWLEFRSSKEAWEMVDRRDVVYAVMLKTFYLCWKKSSFTIESLLSELVDYCLDVLGVFPLKELYFAWKAIVGLSVGHFVPIFDEPDLKSLRKKSINRIGALAWDLYMFRFVEALLTEEKGKVFYIPSVTTLDKGLLNTIASCPLRAMISYDHLQFVETIFDDELLFQQCLDSSLTENQKSKLFDSSRGIKGNKRLRQYVVNSISDSEKRIRELIS